MSVNILSYIVKYWVLTGVGAGVLRISLLDNARTPGYPGFAFILSNIRYMLWASVIAISFLVFGMLPAIVVLSAFSAYLLNPASGQLTVSAWLVGLVCLAPALIVIARLLLIFPAMTVGVDYGVKKVWSLSKGLQIRLAMLVCLLPISIQLFLVILPPTESLVIDLGVSLVWLVLVVFQASVIAKTYQWRVGLTDSL